MASKDGASQRSLTIKISNKMIKTPTITPAST
jgi:hypothetical protein